MQEHSEPARRPASDRDSQRDSSPKTVLNDCALSLVSQRWTLQIARDICEGRTCFNQIQTHLGLSRSLLTMRLQALMKYGIVEPCPLSVSDTRCKYIPTAKGRALYRVIIALQQWAAGGMEARRLKTQAYRGHFMSES
jgi:DNA-binding HxlR family transcriptional regulator